jgi:hypothetical protein
MQKITEIFTWQNYKVEELEKKHKINERAIRDGSGEQPPEKDPGYTVVENEISLECGNYLEEHTEKLRVYLKTVEDNQNKLTTHLEQNHFGEVVNTLEADFNTIVNRKKLILSEQHNEYLTYKAEKEQFQKIHQVYREPNSADTSKTMKAFSLIGILFIFEIFANSFILGGALMGGTTEGLAVSSAVAFLNVIVSSLIGYHVVKNINHIEKPKKTFYAILSTAYLFVVVYINLALGAYRSIAEKTMMGILNDSITLEKRRLALEKAVKFWGPEIDYSFVGIILTFVGISFALISILDGLLYNDSYPGFGKAGQKVNKLKQDIRASFHNYSKDVSDLFQKYNKILQAQYKTLLNTDLNNWDFNTNLIQKEFITYESKVNDLEEKTNHIINEYRTQNKRVRKTPPPSYFEKNFTIDEIKKNPSKTFRDIEHAYMEDKAREAQKVKYHEAIDLKFKKAEQEIEIIEKKSEEIQSTLYEKLNAR